MQVDEPPALASASTPFLPLAPAPISPALEVSPLPEFPVPLSPEEHDAVMRSFAVASPPLAAAADFAQSQAAVPMDTAAESLF